MLPGALYSEPVNTATDFYFEAADLSLPGVGPSPEHCCSRAWLVMATVFVGYMTIRMVLTFGYGMYGEHLRRLAGIPDADSVLHPKYFRR